MDTELLLLKTDLAIVERVRIMDHHASNEQPRLLAPNNQIELFIPIDRPLSFKQLGSARALTFETGSCYIVSPRRKGVAFTMQEGGSCLIVELNPTYTKLVKKSGYELSNRVFQADFAKNSIKHLLYQAANIDRFELSDLLFTSFLKTDDFRVNQTIIDAIALIDQSHGMISIKEIYTDLEISKSKLEQHFNKEIGLTPKEFCKIAKLNHLMRTYREKQQANLTELTYECGYYDQSHLIKDFRYFMETSPKRYLKEDMAHVSLDPMGKHS